MFWQKSTSSVFWRIQVSLGGLPVYLCTPTVQAAETWPPGLPLLSLPQGQPLHRYRCPRVLASWHLDTSFGTLYPLVRYIWCALYISSLSLLCKIQSCFCFHQWPPSGQGSVPQVLVSMPRNRIWHSPWSSFLTAYSGSRTVLSWFLLISLTTPWSPLLVSPHLSHLYFFELAVLSGWISKLLLLLPSPPARWPEPAHSIA